MTEGKFRNRANMIIITTPISKMLAMSWINIKAFKSKQAERAIVTTKGTSTWKTRANNNTVTNISPMPKIFTIMFTGDCPLRRRQFPVLFLLDFKALAGALGLVEALPRRHRHLPILRMLAAVVERARVESALTALAAAEGAERVAGAALAEGVAFCLLELGTAETAASAALVALVAGAGSLVEKALAEHSQPSQSSVAFLLSVPSFLPLFLAF